MGGVPTSRLSDEEQIHVKVGRYKHSFNQGIDSADSINLKCFMSVKLTKVTIGSKQLNSNNIKVNNNK